LPNNVLPGVIVVDLKSALTAGSQFCAQQYPQLKVILLTSKMSGEAGEIGRFLANVASDIHLEPPFFLLAGGETTVSMDSKTSGLGGRNQEMALAVALEMYRDATCSNNITFMAVGTDGTDGPTTAAGAMVTKNTIHPSTLEKAEAALKTHDSFHFFEQNAPASHVITGPTGTNVMDVVIICNIPENSSL